MLADPQETSAADLVWDTGSGCWGEGETGRLSWLPGQVEGVLELTPARMPWRPLAAAEDEDGMSQRCYFPFPQLIPREEDRLSGARGARLGSEELKQDGDSLVPERVCPVEGVLA